MLNLLSYRAPVCLRTVTVGTALFLCFPAIDYFGQKYNTRKPGVTTISDRIPITLGLLFSLLNIAKDQMIIRLQ